MLDDFAPRVESVELELGSSYERTENTIGLV